MPVAADLATCPLGHELVWNPKAREWWCAEDCWAWEAVLHHAALVRSFADHLPGCPARGLTGRLCFCRSGRVVFPY